jgi:hypothetical protein
MPHGGRLSCAQAMQFFAHFDGTAASAPWQTPKRKMDIGLSVFCPLLPSSGHIQMKVWTKTDF